MTRWTCEKTVTLSAIREASYSPPFGLKVHKNEIET